MTSPYLIAALVIGALAGIALGVGTFTFVYARGDSYLTNDPKACANCHVMNEQYDGWVKSSHRQVATCNDCHTPHNFAMKYVTKAVNGYFHSYAFTTGDFHEPIRITERNRKVTEGTCRYCHGEMVSQIDHPPVGKDSGLSCIRCHTGVGHKEIVSTGTVGAASGD